MAEALRVLAWPPRLFPRFAKPAAGGCIPHLRFQEVGLWSGAVDLIGMRESRPGGFLYAWLRPAHGPTRSGRRRPAVASPVRVGAAPAGSGGGSRKAAPPQGSACCAWGTPRSCLRQLLWLFDGQPHFRPQGNDPPPLPPGFGQWGAGQGFSFKSCDMRQDQQPVLRIPCRSFPVLAPPRDCGRYVIRPAGAMNKPPFPPGSLERQWFLVDAAESGTLGRLGTEVASGRCGARIKPAFHAPPRHLVISWIIVNADKIRKSKWQQGDQKIYRRHLPARPGGMKDGKPLPPFRPAARAGRRRKGRSRACCPQRPWGRQLFRKLQGLQGN